MPVYENQSSYMKSMDTYTQPNESMKVIDSYESPPVKSIDDCYHESGKDARTNGRTNVQTRRIEPGLK